MKMHLRFIIFIENICQFVVVVCFVAGFFFFLDVIKYSFGFANMDSFWKWLASGERVGVCVRERKGVVLHVRERRHRCVREIVYCACPSCFPPQLFYVYISPSKTTVNTRPQYHIHIFK